MNNSKRGCCLLFVFLFICLLRRSRNFRRPSRVEGRGVPVSCRKRTLLPSYSLRNLFVPLMLVISTLYACESFAHYPRDPPECCV